MAIAPVGSLGSATSKASGTTVTMVTTATAEVGNSVVVWTAWDNTDTTDGASTRLTCTDESSNTWTKIAEYTETDAGVAEDGLTVAIFYTNVTTQIDTGDDIIVTSSTARVAKAISAFEYTQGNDLVVEQTQTLAAPTGQPAAITLSALPSRQYLLVHACGVERSFSGVVYTQDGDYTNITSAGTSGGASPSNASIFGGFRVATLTTDDVDVALDTGGHHVQIYSALYENAGGAITQAVGQATETELAQTITPITVQYLRPISDITDGDWTEEDGVGTDLYDAINETSFSDVDYIRSSDSPSSPDISEVKVTVGADPGTSDDGANYHIRYRYGKDTSGGDQIDLTVDLVQATTIIATWEHEDVGVFPIAADQSLTNAEANSITDHTDLRLRFTAIKP